MSLIDVALQTIYCLQGLKRKMLIEYTKFYYQALSEEKKSIYKELYEGFKARKKNIEVHVDLRRLTPKDISDIAISVYNDTPSFYYLDVTKYSYIPTPFGYIYSQNYIYTDKEIEEYDRRLEQGLNIFQKKYILPNMTEYQKEKIIHDYLVKTVVYDHEALNSANHIDEAFNVLGPLLKKRAVCWGIACAFKLLCDYCQIKSFVVIGNTIPRQGDAGHAWNMVKINEETFHVDVTWDIKEKGDISFCYDYFNLDDKLILANHTWESKLYPKCDSIKQNYYYKNHLFVKTTSDLSAYISSRLRANDQYIAVKYANAMPTKTDIESAIQAGFLKALKFAPYRYLISELTHNIYIEIV